MKIVLDKEEIKNILAEYIHKREGGDKPSEVLFSVQGNDLEAQIIFPTH